MNQMILIAVGCFAIVGALYGIYGSLAAGRDWKHWFFEQALPLYGVMAVALACLLLIAASITGRSA
jgi:Mg/Co/Ni transporter MgtE